jgi:hypothetical protein
MKQILLFIFLTLYFSSSYCQKFKPTLINNFSSGILTEIGIPYYDYEKGEKYTPLLIGGVFEAPLYKTKNSFNISLSIFPHLGFVFQKRAVTYEYGIGVRANFNFAISKRNTFRAVIGSGPHYFDCYTYRQAYGFLFSDYLLVDYRRYFILNDRYYSFDFEIGYRHISNASLCEPNDGIENIIIGIGFNIVLNTNGKLD